MTCSILDIVDAFVELWAEAILIACHIRNKLLSRSFDEMSSYEV